MHYSNDVLDKGLISKIDADLRQFATDWQSDPTIIGTPDPVAAFCDVMLRGGKRLRGVLAMQSYYAHGGKDDSVALGAARVFEIIQTSLLIVDDIADRSRLRRGGPSAYAALETRAAEDGMKGSALHYGEVQAMNVAYAGLHKATIELLNLAVDAETARRACSQFHANILVTINGQVDDIYNEATPRDVDEEAVESVLKRKSAYYSILSPIELGAQLAGARALSKGLRAYSLHAGCAYQIADDIISTFGREDETGKGSNDDIHEGKLTLLAHYALANSTVEQKRELQSILGNEAATAEECNRVRELFSSIGALDYAKARRTLHETKALSELNGARDAPEAFVDYLRRLTDYLVNRNS
jgi:geranylgeranyl diphosphate synthase type I